MQLVVRPSLTEGQIKAPSIEKLEMTNKLGQRFKMVGWVSLMVLVFTGASQLLDESGAARIETSWGLILMLKLFVFAIVGGLIFVHDLILDPYGPPAKGRREEKLALIFSGKVIGTQWGILGLSLVVLLIAAYLTAI